MKSFHSERNMAAHSPVDLPPGSGSAALVERIAALEEEKFQLQQIICDLLSKNEELRRRIQEVRPALKESQGERPALMRA